MAADCLFNADPAQADAGRSGQIGADAAEVYERFFLPALFDQWPERIARSVSIAPGQRVLDVACGTGVLARALAGRVQPGGSVAGLDLNPGMLDVARRRAPDIEWRHGRAESLPFTDASFDAVVSQFGLMFFADRHAALREMLRVLRPGGRLAVAVCGRLEDSPGYAAVVDLLQRLCGQRAADALRAPFCLGERQTLQALFAEAGIADAVISTHEGTARFESIDAWMHTDVKGWTLADMIDERQYAQLLEAARRELRAYAGADGRVAFAFPAHIVSAAKRRP